MKTLLEQMTPFLSAAEELGERARQRLEASATEALEGYQRFAERGLAATRDGMSHVVEQTKHAVTTRDPAELFRGQTERTAAFVAEMSEHGRAFFDLAADRAPGRADASETPPPADA